MMHMVHIVRNPRYISELVTATASLQSRKNLRCAVGNHHEIPRPKLKLGERSSLYADPVAWNTLPNELTDITDTELFKRKLKTHFCAFAFST